MGSASFSNAETPHFRSRKLARCGTRIWHGFSKVFCFSGSLPVFLVSWFPGFFSPVFLVSFLFHPVFSSEVISWFYSFPVTWFPGFPLSWFSGVCLFAAFTVP